MGKVEQFKMTCPYYKEEAIIETYERETIAQYNVVQGYFFDGTMKCTLSELHGRCPYVDCPHLPLISELLGYH